MFEIFVTLYLLIMTETAFQHVHNTSEEGDYGDDDDDDDDDDDMFEHDDIDMFDQKVRKQTKVTFRFNMAHSNQPR